MSSVIEFLERLGADAQLRHASQEDIARALEEVQMDADVGAAIIARSTSDLYALLKQEPMFHILENPGREDEDEEEEEGDEEGEEKSALAAVVVGCHAASVSA
ncbi:MAG TPA: hypothetical protein VFG49_17465 [Dyella sp.]|uniref:hypothetical protein n=1 Tax=Dyella sp. TaxID=1869338 RepID=UPI002D78C282|nr:hypothetical protein [Dyella sp.]HET6555319.1 hypothetical protein [Dyella sp.]